jgi:hypothetical protein
LANICAKILFLGSDKSYFVGKNITKSSVHLTAYQKKKEQTNTTQRTKDGAR